VGAGEAACGEVAEEAEQALMDADDAEVERAGEDAEEAGLGGQEDDEAAEDAIDLARDFARQWHGIDRGLRRLFVHGMFLPSPPHRCKEFDS